MVQNETRSYFTGSLWWQQLQFSQLGEEEGGKGGIKASMSHWEFLKYLRCVRKNVQRPFYTCLQTVFIKFSKCISQVMSGISIIFCKKLQSRGSLRSMRCVRRNVHGQRGLFVPLASGSIGREAALLAQQWVFAVNTSVQKVFAENTMCRNAREMYSLADSLLVKDGREVLAITSYDWILSLVLIQNMILLVLDISLQPKKLFI